MVATPLISAIKSSDSGLYASLHPLVLLTISDYITRHSLRHQQQPIVGALLGQQKGREITIEHAYDVKLLPPTGPQIEWKLNESFFADRLQQYKDVHKEPALELVGWWTISSSAGPGMEVLGIHTHVLHTFNETALLLAFHPEAVGEQAESWEQGQVGSQMPLTIYESMYEAVKGDADGDTIMADDGEGKEGTKLEIKLRELPYDIVTGEAEMISVDFVAKGSGNANLGVKNEEREAAEINKDKGKAAVGPSREDSKKNNALGTTLNLEEEELVSFLNSRANAIKMLQSRIALLKSYLTQLPSSYLTDATISIQSISSSKPRNTASLPISHPVLRSILAMTSRLPHLLPADNDIFTKEQADERSDVEIVSMMGNLCNSIAEAKDLGRTFAVLENARAVGKKSRGGYEGIGDFSDTSIAIEAAGGDWDSIMS